MKHPGASLLQPWQPESSNNIPGISCARSSFGRFAGLLKWTERTVGGQWKPHEYPRYFFSNASAEVLTDPGSHVGTGRGRRADRGAEQSAGPSSPPG